MSPAAEIPPFPTELDLLVVSAVFRRQGYHFLVPSEAILVTAVELAPQVRTAGTSGFSRRYLVGKAEVIDGHDWDSDVGYVSLVCRACNAVNGCAHALAVRLALAWNDPALRRALSMRAWQHVLGPLVEGAEHSAEAPERAPATEGWIRYTLASPEVLESEALQYSRKSLLHGLLERQLVRVSKKSGAPLVPIKCPEQIEQAALKVRVTENDREIDRCFREARALDALTRNDYGYGRAVERGEEVIEELTGRALSLLLDAQELRFGDGALTLERDPIVPRIVIEDGPAGSLVMRWAPPVVAVYPFGAGYVVTEARAFCALQPGLPRPVWGLLGRPLPPVPPKDIGAFLREVVLKSPVPIDLTAKALPHTSGLVAPRPRLRLTDHDGTLEVAPVFVYADVDAVREVPASEPSPWVVFREAGGTPHLAERDAATEARLMASLAALVPGPFPAHLTGDAALEFLFEATTEGGELKATWEILVDARLAGVRSVGRFAPKVSVETGIDWFDVQVEFLGTGRAKASLGVLLESWRAGRRYLRLPNGSIGRIPSEWLARHGTALEQLGEMRQATSGKLRAFAAPLAAELLEDEALAPAARRWRAVAEKIRAFAGVPQWPVPPGVVANIRDYQTRGFHWLVWLRDLDLGGVLADDMGLGKTLQALMLLWDTHAEAGGAPSLVVAPTSVVHNWVDEAAKFTPELKVVLHHGAGRGKTLPADADVIVTSYAIVRQDEALFREASFRYAILDEAQTIKNPASQIAQTCQGLKADHRLAITGTPLENNLVELWSLFHFLMPGFFGTRAAFNTRFGTPIQKYQDDEAMTALRGRIRPFILRRRKDEVAKELPPRTEQVLYCELDPAQRRLYESVKETFREQVLNRVAEVGVGRSTIQVLEALTRLRQACCDPRLLPFEEARKVESSAKRTLLLETLAEIIAEGHRTLVFSQWPSLLKLVEADLIAGHIDYLYLDGSTTERAPLVKRWNAEGGPPVFLISLKAGGTGLNLTGADHVIHLDPWWNPAAEAQASDRAHRIGQTKPVMVYKLVARDTVEDKILELQARKKALFDAAVDAERLVVDSLTRADLEAVFAPGR